MLDNNLILRHLILNHLIDENPHIIINDILSKET